MSPGYRRHIAALYGIAATVTTTVAALAAIQVAATFRFWSPCGVVWRGEDPIHAPSP